MQKEFDLHAQKTAELASSLTGEELEIESRQHSTAGVFFVRMFSGFQVWLEVNRF